MNDSNSLARIACIVILAGAVSACGEASPDEAVVQTSDAVSTPSSKATAFFGDIAILPSTDLAWTTIMDTQLKTSMGKTLFINASLECGLETSTTVHSKNGTQDTSSATAAVELQVLVDGVAASPGQVVYCRRTQTLSATLGGILQSCTDTNGDGTITASECNMTDEEISLLLSTMNADSFNFGANVGTGTHDIAVQAMISTATSAQTGSATAFGEIGKGSVVVTEQRLAK